MPEYTWITDRIFTVAEFFTAAECRACVKLAESLGFHPAPVSSFTGPQIRPDVRNNQRVMFDDPPRAAELWERISDYVPLKFKGRVACGVNERFRIYRYDVGQQFEWHYDGAFERPNGERSQLTFMVYLNDDFTGGETTLEEVEIIPRRGLALVFDHQLRHKGQLVTGGRKYVLRTDVMYRDEGS